jgi:hypothetical protein
MLTDLASIATIIGLLLAVFLEWPRLKQRVREGPLPLITKVLLGSVPFVIGFAGAFVVWVAGDDRILEQVGAALGILGIGTTLVVHRRGLMAAAWGVPLTRIFAMLCLFFGLFFMFMLLISGTLQQT